VEADDLTQLQSHFAFGRNWAQFAQKVSEEQTLEAVIGMQRLLQSESLAGKRFIDIGCGSGIHSLAALRMGADEVVAVDIDPDSVGTTRSLLEQYAPTLNWRVLERSVFALSPAELGRFDVVYSWGVLHHTGKLEKAISAAAGLVAAGGEFVVALYMRTLLCRLWTVEKQWYSKASSRAQRLARALYVFLYRIRSVIRGQSFKRYVAEYQRRRGMEFYTDVHDWMGGYPYESISVREMDNLMRPLGFARVRIDSLPTGPFASIGVFGTGCTEFVYKIAVAA
jgi:SAM-dependent methyltransferase